jgi:hypothetical protein
VVLTYQRGGQAGTIIALIYLFFWGRGLSRTTRPMVVFGSIAVAAAGLLLLATNPEVKLEYYLERRNDYDASSVMANRSGYVIGMDYVSSFPFGVGLGGSGNAASDAGLQQWGKVVDANYMRVFADLGMQGLLLFLVIIGFGIHAGWRKRKNLGMSCIIFIFALVAVGTNVFDGHLTPHIFWLVMGMADTTAKEPETAALRNNDAETAVELLEPSAPVPSRT